MKLWEKGYSPDQAIEHFTVGKDPQLDMKLLPYDLQGSRAHALVLKDCGILTSTECEQLIRSLDEIEDLWKQGSFQIEMEDEDGHTAIEKYLTEQLGDLGKKIHTARSRNDQVITALRLFEKETLSEITQSVELLILEMTYFAEAHQQIPLPGFTHTRKAMPNTIGLWAEAFRDALQDDLILLKSCIQLIDQNPLGTGAGYGVPFPLNRSVSTKAMGFSRTMANPVYVQNSRGKLEGTVLHVCTTLLMTLNRWASDLILFTMPEFGFFSLADELTTGSSIMPHKKNPDVLELIRSSVHPLMSYQMQVQNMSLNLISGYHRDIQLSKEPLMNGLERTEECLLVARRVMQGLQVQEDSLEAAMTDDLYSVQKVYELVQKGVPFREAYQMIAANLFGTESKS